MKNVENYIEERLKTYLSPTVNAANARQAFFFLPSWPQNYIWVFPEWVSLENRLKSVVNPLSNWPFLEIHSGVHIVGWELGLKLFSGWVLVHSLQSRCVTWNCLGPNFSLEPLLCIGFFFQKNIASSAAFEKQRFWLVNENVSVSACVGKYLVPDSLHPWVHHTYYHVLPDAKQLDTAGLGRFHKGLHLQKTLIVSL